MRKEQKDFGGPLTVFDMVFQSKKEKRSELALELRVIAATHEEMVFEVLCVRQHASH